MKKNTLKQSMLAVLLGVALLLPGCGADDKNVAEKDTTEHGSQKHADRGCLRNGRNGGSGG